MPGKRRPQSIVLRIIALVLVVGVIAFLAFVLATGMRAYGRVTSLRHRLDQVQTIVNDGASNGHSTSPEDMIAALRPQLQGSEQDLKALRGDVAPLLPLAAYAGWLPQIGPSLQAAPHLLSMAEDATQAGSILLDALSPVLSSLSSTGGTGEQTASITERMLPPLIQAQPALVSAQDLLERATAERSAIDSSQLLPPIAKLLDRLDAYLPGLRAASQGATVAPLLLGAERPMTYLVLAQNNDELRPTGGFISAIGVLTLDKGKITRLDMQDSYSVDNWQRDQPAPPEPLLQYMDSQLWVFRDSNFWPDFPTSARAAEFFSQLDLDIKPDGVIAVDQYALQDLVGGLGSLSVPEYDNDVLTRDNVISKLREYWQPPGDMGKDWANWLPWYGQRKQFMAYVVEALRARLETDTQSLDLAQLGSALFQALNEKHILVYLDEPLGHGLVEGTTWGGAVRATDGDYLFVVDTNMGFNKANGIMEKTISYTVSIDASGLSRSQLVVSYHNPSTRQVECIHDSYYEGSYDLMMNRCYWNYGRIYLPKGTTLIADENGNDPTSAPEEAGKDVWSTWMVVAPQQTQQVSLGYYLPAATVHRLGDEREYHLIVQKQPGTDTTPLSVTVSLPAGAQLISASPAATSISNNLLRFESNLLTDEEITVRYR